MMHFALILRLHRDLQCNCATTMPNLDTLMLLLESCPLPRPASPPPQLVL